MYLRSKWSMGIGQLAKSSIRQGELIKPTTMPQNPNSNCVKYFRILQSCLRGCCWHWFPSFATPCLHSSHVWPTHLNLKNRLCVHIGSQSIIRNIFFVKPPKSELEQITAWQSCIYLCYSELGILIVCYRFLKSTFLKTLLNCMCSVEFCFFKALDRWPLPLHWTPCLNSPLSSFLQCWHTVGRV